MKDEADKCHGGIYGSSVTIGVESIDNSWYSVMIKISNSKKTIFVNGVNLNNYPRKKKKALKRFLHK